MKTSPVLKSTDHPSYKAHRRQMRAQILLPVLLAALVFILVPSALWLTRVGGAGDVGRWAAISTMWLLVPVVILLFILLAILILAVYLASRLSALVPTYGLLAQRVAERAAWGTRRAAEMVRRPVLAVRAVGSAVKDRFNRLRERA